MKGFGLLTMALGISMFIKGKHMLIVILSLAVGGILGVVLGLKDLFYHFSEIARQLTSGETTFNEGLITAFLLYCVGPLTILGCLQDGLEKKIDILALKSFLDGVTAIFLSASLGTGVLVSALLVFVFQALLTLFARALKPLTEKSGVMENLEATGGLLLIAIGFQLLDIADLHPELYLPALILAPLITLLLPKSNVAFKQDS